MEGDDSSEAGESQEAREPTDDDVALIAEQLRAGTDQETIAAMLEDRGLDGVRARELVDTLYPQLARVAEEERYTGSALGPGIARRRGRRRLPLGPDRDPERVRDRHRRLGHRLPRRLRGRPLRRRREGHAAPGRRRRLE